ncbi:TetR/AcrR family transcriptional regulator [Nonomuraea sp. NN258]|nr:TetR/AcrR family transcriptional regulator [Nonomuraea antri]
MSPDDRRAMIVKAALPLVVEYGTSVTTAQVARAAGIGEGTLFRAFGDKDALLAACMAEAARPDDALAHVAAISLDQPLRERLVEAVETMQAHLARMGAVAGALTTSGGLRHTDRLRLEHRRRSADRPSPEDRLRPEDTPQPADQKATDDDAGVERPGVDRHGADGRGADGQRAAGQATAREASMAASRDVLAGLFEPDRAELKLDPHRLATAFQFLVMATGRDPDPITPAELVDLFLHGATQHPG